MAHAPKCKLCGTKHWLAEPHVFQDSVTKTLRPVTKVLNNVTPVTKGRPRKYSDNAARQAAYRARLGQ